MGFPGLKNWWYADGVVRTCFRVAVLLLAFEALAIADARTAMALALTSSAFAPGEKIPSKYTCEGSDLSPPLGFADVPDGTKSLVLIVDDPDAPDPKAPKRVWVHWLVYNLPPDSTGLPENASSKGLPSGAVTGVNDRKMRSYHGPCPPIGRHRYFFKLYALDTVLPAEAFTKAELQAAMTGHVLAQAELIGTYQKGDR
jgi:Raf kinase inhibitor-like YbhB/YbcL family protein